MYNHVFYLQLINKLLQVEHHIGEYLRKNETHTHEVVSLYMKALQSVGAGWYSGEYPLVLLDNVFYLWIKVGI